MQALHKWLFHLLVTGHSTATILTSNWTEMSAQLDPTVTCCDSFLSELLDDWRLIANQFVLTTIPLRFTTSNFIFQLNTCSYSPYVTSSLMSGWICPLNCCWSSPAQLFSGQIPSGLMTHLTVSDSRLPEPGGPGPPQALGWLVISHCRAYNISARITTKTRFPRMPGVFTSPLLRYGRPF
jgi:hypothetical protein